MSIAVVTGASRGIGRATALALAARGVDVAVLARTLGDLETVAGRAKDLGVRSLAIRCDVTSADDVAAARDRVLAELGTPRLVVNNAGMIRRAAVHEMSLDDFRLVLETNLVATFLVTRAFLPSMLAANLGRFIQVASISSTLGTARASAYCAAKWGVVGFTKSLAEELRGTGLSTLSVLPGSVDTAMLEGSGFAPQMTPDEVAGTVAYAGLDAPAAMNGSSIEIFG
ncbi:MAG TPA: SDR family oxidoreductase [Polyangiaceae bacterium]|nr:SDR family oxidoreductase [Polyangiaceae bacterium]